MKQTLLLLCFLTLFACRKDSETITENESNHIPKVFLIDDFEPMEEPVTASVLGKVLNENGYPVANAEVSLGDEILFTNEEGSFLFRETMMNAAGTFIKVEKTPGLFASGSRFFPKEGSENYLTIRLLPIQTGGSFRSDENTFLELDQNLTIDLQANSLLLASGAVYEGTVFISSHYLKPEEEKFMEFLPGNLQGINRKSEEVALSSYGAIAIRLFSADGDRLRVDEEKKAKLALPLSESQIENPPEKIPIWSFNELYGLWQDQGDFILEENTYTGEVAQLDFIQLATSFQSTNLSGSLQNQDGQPIPNLLVKLTDERSLVSSYAYTDNEGSFNCPTPTEQSIMVSAMLNESSCLVLQRIEEISSTDKDLGNITLTESNELMLSTMTGTLTDCVEENINDYFIEVITETENYCYYNLNNNQINFSIPVCNLGDILTVNLKDMNNFHESGALVADLGADLEFGETILCGDGEADYIVIKFPADDALFFYDPVLVTDSMTRITGFENTSKQIDISFSGITTGSYTDSDVNIFSGAFPSIGNTITIECNTGGCGFDQLVVDEYGTMPGERVRGHFSGGGSFSLDSAPGNGGVQVPFEGEFSVTIK